MATIFAPFPIDLDIAEAVRLVLGSDDDDNDFDGVMAGSPFSKNYMPAKQFNGHLAWPAPEFENQQVPFWFHDHTGKCVHTTTAMVDMGTMTDDDLPQRSPQPRTIPANLIFVLKDYDLNQYESIYPQKRKIFSMDQEYFVHHLFAMSPPPKEGFQIYGRLEEVPPGASYHQIFTLKNEAGAMETIFWRKEEQVIIQNQKYTCYYFSKAMVPTVVTNPPPPINREIAAIDAISPPIEEQALPSSPPIEDEAPFSQPIQQRAPASSLPPIQEEAPPPPSPPMEEEEKDEPLNDQQPPKLPITTLQKFQSLERIQYESLEVQLKPILVRVGGKDYKDCTRNTLKRLMGDQVRCKYNWDGRRRKFAFKGLNIKSVLFDSIRENFPESTDYDLQVVTQQWLKNVRLPHP